MTRIEQRGDGGSHVPASRGPKGQVDAHHHADCERNGLTRRRVLAAIGAGATISVAGCLSAQTPDPVTLGTDDACDVCGMIISQHPGPSAEVFYQEEKPSDHDNPARFDTTWEAFQYDFERRDRGWTRTTFYVTNYSSVDDDIFSDAGTTFISTHPAAEAFTPASDVTFVVGSSVEGAMGRDLIAFSDDEDATDFAAEYGGSEAEFDDVTRSTIAELAQS